MRKVHGHFGPHEEESTMKTSQPSRRAERQGHLAALQRRTALDLIAQSLRQPAADSTLRPQFEGLGRRRPLHRQPWRQPRRPSFAPLSMMEIIRRYEASHSLN
jgi:hypothetical protein